MDELLIEKFLNAIRVNDQPEINRLLEDDPGLSYVKTKDGTSAYLFALYHRRPDVAALLKTHGLKLTIYESCAGGDLERTRELLAEDPRLLGFFSHDGWTPLHLAAHFGQMEIVDLLVDLGADMHLVSMNDLAVMPIHSALAASHADIALKLIERGADIEARQPTYEYTPLHYAAAQGLTDVVKQLIELGATRNPMGVDGKTPADLAKEKGHTEVEKLLQSA